MRPFFCSACRPLFFLLLLLNSNNVPAQYNTSGIYTKTYKAPDGLPDSYILTIYQDSHQYLWIGTYSGLSRFDGKTFTNYGISNGLPDLFVNAILEDKQNRLWIATRKGVGYLQNNTYIPTLVNDKLDIDYIFNLAYINNKMWACT